MSTKMNCPKCGNLVSNALEEYAEHIFTEHSDDVELCEWARGELAKIGKSSNDSKPKFMGKDIDHIAPNKQKKLPKYLQRQLK